MPNVVPAKEINRIRDAGIGIQAERIRRHDLTDWRLTVEGLPDELGHHVPLGEDPGDVLCFVYHHGTTDVLVLHAINAGGDGGSLGNDEGLLQGKVTNRLGPKGAFAIGVHPVFLLTRSQYDTHAAHVLNLESHGSRINS